MSVVSPTVTVTIHAVPVPSLTITVDKTTGYPGDTFYFTGNFTQNGTPIVGKTVTLYRNGLSVGSVATDGFGDYLIGWVANVEGSLVFHTEAAIPPRPPILSRTIGVGIGLEVPRPLVTTLTPFIFGGLLVGIALMQK